MPSAGNASELRQVIFMPDASSIAKDDVLIGGVIGIKCECICTGNGSLDPNRSRVGRTRERPQPRYKDKRIFIRSNVCIRAKINIRRPAAGNIEVTV